MLLGITASFMGAFCQAVNYSVTQSCQQKYRIDGIRLLVAIHVCIGMIALVPTLIFGYWKLLGFHLSYDFIKINVPYLFAQYFLIKAIRLSDSSVVSPLLALKIPVLALIAIFLFDAHFGMTQWLSMALILALGYYFSAISGRINIAPLLLVIGASVGYGLSDMAITELSHNLIQAPAIEQAFATISLNYTVCGVLSLPLMKPMQVSPTMAYQAKWVSITWFVAVIFLTVGFNVSGVVSGNIVQSLRGVIGVILAFIFFREQINESNAIWRKKLLAAVGMFVAVGVFYI